MLDDLSSFNFLHLTKKLDLFLLGFGFKLDQLWQRGGLKLNPFIKQVLNTKNVHNKSERSKLHFSKDFSQETDPQ